MVLSKCVAEPIWQICYWSRKKTGTSSGSSQATESGHLTLPALDQLFCSRGRITCSIVIKYCLFQSKEISVYVNLCLANFSLTLYKKPTGSITYFRDNGILVFLGPRMVICAEIGMYNVQVQKTVIKYTEKVKVFCRFPSFNTECKSSRVLGPLTFLQELFSIFFHRFEIKVKFGFFLAPLASNFFQKFANMYD